MDVESPEGEKIFGLGTMKVRGKSNARVLLSAEVVSASTSRHGILKRGGSWRGVDLIIRYKR